MAVPDELRLSDEESAAYKALVAKRAPVEINSLMLDKLLTVLYEQNAAIHELTTTLYHSASTGVTLKSDVASAASKARQSLNHIHGMLKEVAAAAATEGKKDG